MNAPTKVLIIILALTALIPTKLGILCLFDHENALGFFSMTTLTPEIEKLFIVLGCFVLTTVAFQVLAIAWLIRGKAEAFSLSAIVGAVSIARGITMFHLLPSHNSNELRLSVTPIVFGSVILILTIIASKKQKLT